MKVNLEEKLVLQLEGKAKILNNCGRGLSAENQIAFMYNGDVISLQ